MTLDWEIYCELYRQLDDPVWGMLPHPSVAAIAKRLGVTRGHVWRRLMHLQKIGFIRGYEVIPNPTLLGVGLRTYTVTIPDPRARSHFLDELEAVDGVFLALTDVGPSGTLITVSDFPASRSRREKLILRIDGVESLGHSAQAWLPKCTYAPTLEGWRFLSALRANPTGTMERLAADLRISSKTASRRYRLLLEGRAILGSLIEDFARFPGLVVGEVLELANGADPQAVTDAVQRLQPEALPIPSPIRPPKAALHSPSFLRLARSASDSEAGAIALGNLPGVAGVTTFFPGACRAYRHWFDARIFEILARHGR